MNKMANSDKRVAICVHAVHYAFKNRVMKRKSSFVCMQRTYHVVFTRLESKQSVAIGNILFRSKCEFNTPLCKLQT